jgi:hypothetical protein
VTDTAGLSWNDLNTVCSTGICTADFGTVDLTSWRWATADDVRSLLNEFIFAATGTSPLGDFYFELNSTWAPSFFSFFTPLTVSPNGVDLIGTTRDESPALPAFFAVVAQVVSLVDGDFISIGAGGKNFNESFEGAFLYQPSDSTSVPEPASLMLLGLGLVVVAARRRRPPRY